MLDRSFEPLFVFNVETNDLFNKFKRRRLYKEEK